MVGVLFAQEDSGSLITELTVIAGNSIYAVQGIVAVIGLWCVIMVWRKLGKLRFVSEEEQTAFLDQVNGSLDAGDFDTAQATCEVDGRAVPQLAFFGIANRALPFNKLRELIVEQFHRNVLMDIDKKMSWVFTAIKTAPMLGLLGTVLGMMAAFDKLAGKTTQIQPSELAGDISLALITTFVGLSIAIPLMLCVTVIQMRQRQLEDLVNVGVNRFLEFFKIALGRFAGGGR